MVQASWLRVWGLGLRVYGKGFMAEAFGFRTSGVKWIIMRPCKRVARPSVSPA